MPVGCFHLTAASVALQTLWVGPWLSRVCGWTPLTWGGLQRCYALNIAMLPDLSVLGCAHVPRLTARGWTAQAL